jgi:predicted phosphate transport protein (TIGR00153 family)
VSAVDDYLAKVDLPKPSPETLVKLCIARITDDSSAEASMTKDTAWRLLVVPSPIGESPGTSASGLDPRQWQRVIAPAVALLQETKQKTKGGGADAVLSAGWIVDALVTGEELLGWLSQTSSERLQSLGAESLARRSRFSDLVEFGWKQPGQAQLKILTTLAFITPHDEQFFVLFDKLTKIIVEAAETLRTLPSQGKNEREATVTKIQELENKADSITHVIYTELNKTFVTPFDREDVHLLASTLDDVVDYIDGTAKRFHMYKIKKNSADIQRLTEIIYQSALEIQRGVILIADMRRADELHSILQKINQYENDADSIFDHAIAELFEHETDAIELIKIKEVLVNLETTTDKCEDVANVLETLFIKNA